MIVNLALYFNRKEDEQLQYTGNEQIDFTIPLIKELIFAIKKYQIPVENQKELDFIMSNKKTAVTQILKYGKLKTE